MTEEEVDDLSADFTHMTKMLLELEDSIRTLEEESAAMSGSNKATCKDTMKQLQEQRTLLSQLKLKRDRSEVCLERAQEKLAKQKNIA